MIKITLHSLPSELDQINWIIDQLTRSARYIDPSRIILDFTLNVSDDDIDWDKSRVSKDFCVEKFELLFNKSPFVNDPKVSYSHTGCNTVRRNAIRASDNVTHIIGLDPDLIFSDTLLYYLVGSIDKIKEEYHIITPQIFQLWDTSWDVISHTKTKNTPREEKLWLQDPFMVFDHEPSNVKLVELPYFKFSGGWMTVYSKKLLQLIDLPDSLGHYGLDDTFISSCANILKDRGYNVKSYLLEDVVVMEDRVYRSSTMAPFIQKKTLQDSMRDNSHINFNKEIEDFKQRI